MCENKIRTFDKHFVILLNCHPFDYIVNLYFKWVEGIDGYVEKLGALSSSKQEFSKVPNKGN